MNLILLAALLGCSNVIDIEVWRNACVDWTPGEESTVEVTEVDEDWHVAHTGVEQGCDDAFEPDVQGDGKVLTVREYWTEQTEDDCTMCFSPTIVLKAPPPGSYELGWYEGDSPSPVDVVEFEVD